MAILCCVSVPSEQCSDAAQSNYPAQSSAALLRPDYVVLQKVILVSAPSVLRCNEMQPLHDLLLVVIYYVTSVR